MQAVGTTIGLLIISNVFMTFAWYAHLKELNNKPWVIAALIREPVKLDYVWAALCMFGAVYFMFRAKLSGT